MPQLEQPNTPQEEEIAPERALQEEVLTGLEELSKEEATVRALYGSEIQEYEQLLLLLPTTPGEAEALHLAIANLEVELYEALTPIIDKKEVLQSESGRLHGNAWQEAIDINVRGILAEVFPKAEEFVNEIEKTAAQIDDRNKPRARDVGYFALTALRKIEQLMKKKTLTRSDGALTEKLVIQIKIAHDEVMRLNRDQFKQNRYGK